MAYTIEDVVRNAEGLGFSQVKTPPKGVRYAAVIRRFHVYTLHITTTNNYHLFQRYKTRWGELVNVVVLSTPNAGTMIARLQELFGND